MTTANDTIPPHDINLKYLRFISVFKRHLLTTLDSGNITEMLLPLTGTTYDPREKVWSGPITKDFYNINMTLGEAIIMQLVKQPKKIIQMMDTTGETLNAEELMDYASILAQNLLKYLVQPKDIVGLYAQNTIHVSTVMLASFLCGTPVNSLYPGFDKDNIVQLYQNTRPRLIYCDVENYENARQANEELQLGAKLVLMNGFIAGVTNIKELLLNQDPLLPSLPDFPCKSMTGRDTAVILFSSGTTGTPKGVMCSHQALLNKNIYVSTTSNSILLSFSTMYWATGLLNLVSSLLNANLRIVTDKPFTSEYFLYLVKRYQITHALCSANQVAELILNHSKEEIRLALKSIDTLICGGAKVPNLVQDKMLDILSDNKERTGFGIVYGMTEVSGGATFNGGFSFHHPPYTEGKVLANHQMRIVEKCGSTLGPNKTGEIQIYSPYTWLGYYNNAEATEKALSGKWLRSGDVGYFDDLGYLHVSGRDKDMFKTGGFQICPQLIEDVILRLTGVAEVCVFPVPDFQAENLIACAIVRKADDEGAQLEVDKVQEYTLKHLNHLYQLKGGVYFVESIPKTSSGKMIRQNVAKLLKLTDM